MVDTGHVGRVPRATGTALLQVLPGGENAIVVSPGANASLTPIRVNACLEGLRAGDILMCQLESPIEAVAEALAVAKARGATTVLDPAPASERLAGSLLRRVDTLTPNSEEAASLLGIRRDATGAILKGLAGLGPSVVILNLGSEHAWACSGGTVPPHAVRAGEITAAGDTFNGAPTAALARG